MQPFPQWPLHSFSMICFKGLFKLFRRLQDEMHLLSYRPAVLVAPAASEGSRPPILKSTLDPAIKKAPADTMRIENFSEESWSYLADLLYSKSSATSHIEAGSAAQFLEPVAEHLGKKETGCKTMGMLGLEWLCNMRLTVSPVASFLGSTWLTTSTPRFVGCYSPVDKGPNIAINT